MADLEERIPNAFKEKEDLNDTVEEHRQLSLFEIMEKNIWKNF